jgi:hypothetical protein
MTDLNCSQESLPPADTLHCKVTNVQISPVPPRGIDAMAISNVSPAAANLHSPQIANKPAQPQQSIKPAAPPAVKPADTDGDRDGSGINVKA